MDRAGRRSHGRTRTQDEEDADLRARGDRRPDEEDARAEEGEWATSDVSGELIDAREVRAAQKEVTEFMKEIELCENSTADDCWASTFKPRRGVVVQQRCFEIKCASVSHAAHAKVQSLCQEGTENGECDVKCIEGYTIASNTLKCKAVDF